MGSGKYEALVEYWPAPSFGLDNSLGSGDQLSDNVSVCKLRQTYFHIGKILYDLLIHSLLFENNKERKQITLNFVA